jgi:glycine dehydrogenase subunit 1
MNAKKDFIHPYIPNSVPANKEAMMKKIGITDIDQLYEDIPEHLRLRKKMNIPKAILSEALLKKHVEKILAKNQSCEDRLSFLGGDFKVMYMHLIQERFKRITQKE